MKPMFKDLSVILVFYIFLSLFPKSTPLDKMPKVLLIKPYENTTKTLQLYTHNFFTTSSRISTVKLPSFALTSRSTTPRMWFPPKLIQFNGYKVGERAISFILLVTWRATYSFKVCRGTDYHSVNKRESVSKHCLEK